jgi:hypothetical protein
MSLAAITFCVASQLVVPMVSIYFVINSVRKLLVTPSYAVKSGFIVVLFDTLSVIRACIRREIQ